MRRLLRLPCVFSFAIACVGVYALYASWAWPFRTALFPRVLALPIIFLSLMEFALSAWSVEGKREGHAVDFQFTDSVEPTLAMKRTIATGLWTLGFFALILLVGFPLAVPIFVFLYLRIAGSEPWMLTITLTALSWVFMEGLFDKFLHLPFPDGWIFTLWN